MTRTGNKTKRLEQAIREIDNVEIPESLEIRIKNLSEREKMHLSIEIICDTPKLEAWLAHNHFTASDFEKVLKKIYPTKYFSVKIDSVGIFRTSIHLGVYAYEK